MGTTYGAVSVSLNPLIRPLRAQIRARTSFGPLVRMTAL
jgi:hypothetical protein